MLIDLIKRHEGLSLKPYMDSRGFLTIGYGRNLDANGISKSEAEYLRPLQPCDKVRITVTPQPLSENSFALQFEVHRLGPPDKLAARVRTEHVCTSPAKRSRIGLPAALAAWVGMQ